MESYVDVQITQADQLPRFMQSVPLRPSMRDVETTDRSQPIGLPDGTGVVVKIQIPLSNYGLPMLVYDKDRKVHENLTFENTSPENYRKIYELIVADGVNQVKAFLSAKVLESGKVLRIDTSCVVEPHSW